MIELRQGDILHADAEALVNTVNCVGIGQVQLGKMLVFDLNRLQNPRYIINFPTKHHWKGKSRIQDIEAGLKALLAEIRLHNIRSVALPPLGCGLGGLDWSKVRPIIEYAFDTLPDVRVLLHEPSGALLATEMVAQRKYPNMTAARAALLGLVRRYMTAVLDPSVSLLEIHKLMYFMQEAGEPLKLKYGRASYGPYAENLRHLLTQIEGHFIHGYGDAEDDPQKQIELEPTASEQAESFLAAHSETRERFKRVAELIDGFETPFGMELLATVHWVGVREGAKSVEQAIAKTYAWNDRKRMFKIEHIGIAWDILESKGWLETSGARAGLRK